MDKGTKVVVDWDAVCAYSQKLFEKIAAIGDAVCEVIFYDGVGICLVELPDGVTLPEDVPVGSNDNRQCIELHQSHLKLAA